MRDGLTDKIFNRYEAVFCAAIDFSEVHENISVVVICDFGRNH